MAERKIPRARLLVALLALTGFAVACGDDDTTETATADPEPADTSEPAEDTESEPEPVEEPEPEPEPAEEPESEPEPELVDEIDLRVPASFSVVQPIDQVEPRPAVEPLYPIGDRVCPSGADPRQDLETLVEFGLFDAPTEIIPAENVTTYLSAPLVVAQRYEADPAAFFALFGDGQCEIGAWTIDGEFEDFITSVDVPLGLEGPTDREWLAVTLEPPVDHPSGTLTGLLLIAGSDSVAFFVVPESTQLASPEQARERIAGLLQEILDLY